MGQSTLSSIKKILNQFPVPVLIMNSDETIVFGNSLFHESFKGNSQGEIDNHRAVEPTMCENEHGCESKELCIACGIREMRFDEQCRSRCRLKEMVQQQYSGFHNHEVSFNEGTATYTAVFLLHQTAIADGRFVEEIDLHDIMNTLTLLQLYCNSIDSESDADLLDHKHMIVNLIADVIQQMVSYRALRHSIDYPYSIAPSAIHSATILNEVAGMFKKNTMYKKHHILIDGDAEDFLIVSKEIFLKRVLVNLVKNALEATPTGGRIILDSNIVNEGFEFSVSNNSFIKEKIQKVLFQKGGSSKGPDRGLGLFGAKYITEQYLNGKISYTTTKEYGTVFRVTVKR